MWQSILMQMRNLSFAKYNFIVISTFADRHYFLWCVGYFIQHFCELRCFAAHSVFQFFGSFLEFCCLFSGSISLVLEPVLKQDTYLFRSFVNHR